MKSRPKVSNKTKAELQKEINSECPFCANNDVGCFEIHHLDGNPANNESSNLLMLCPTCHTKIEKDVISGVEVQKVKNELRYSKGKIEFVSVVVDSVHCNWEVSEDSEYAFFEANGKKSPHPILNFTFINHLAKTVVLKTIEVKIKDLPSGLSGLPPEPKVLKPLVKYSLRLKRGRDVNVFPLSNPLSIPAGQGFLFQVELSISENRGGVVPIDGRMVAYFTFHFSDNIKIKPPTVCFNCNDENEKMKIYILS